MREGNGVAWRVLFPLALLTITSCWTSSAPSVDDEQAAKNRALSMSKELQRLVDSQLGEDQVREISLSVAGGMASETVHVSAGDANGTPMNEHTPYFLASLSKLFATAMIMQLRQEQRLTLDDPIVRFFPSGELTGLHVYDGRDMTSRITVRQLLAHTSGLADYYGDKRRDGTRLSTDLFAGGDVSWSLQDVIDIARDELQPQFAPGSGDRAHYADTNYQLLGGIIESLTGRTLADNIQMRIAGPLSLASTFLFTMEPDQSSVQVLPLRHGNQRPDIPEAMSSARLDGAMVSTSAESLVFLRAFMTGELFPVKYLDDMQQWRATSYPLESGVGLLKFRLPWYLSPFGKRSPMVGYSGNSGAFAYYSPSDDVYIAGTINQLASRLPYGLLMKGARMVAR